MKLDRLAVELDLRALTWFRTALGGTLVLDLLSRARDLDAHYGSSGVLPSDVLAAHPMVPHLYSIHGWAAELGTGALATLFAVHIMAAVAFMLGWRVRLSGLVSWLLLLSLQARNPWLSEGGDTLLRMLFFWALFLPLRGRGSWRGFPATALLVQVALVYLLAGLSKLHGPWLSGNAVAEVMANHLFATAIGRDLLQYPALLRILTYATLLLEIVGPLVFVFTFRHRQLRLVLIGCFWAFHLSSAISMHLGLFPLVSMVAWLPFIPVPGSGSVREGERAIATASGAGDALVAVLLVYVVLWNVRLLVPGVPVLPHEFDFIGRVLRISQQWSLFPSTKFINAWPTVIAEKQDGSRVELVPYRIEESRAVDACRVPRSAAEAYGGVRWRKLLAYVLVKSEGWLRGSYLDWICRASREPFRSVELLRSGPGLCAEVVLERRSCGSR